MNKYILKALLFKTYFLQVIIRFYTRIRVFFTLFAFFFFSLFFPSCDSSESLSVTKNIGQTNADAPEKIEIQKKMDKASFFLNEENGWQVLTALCFDENGKEIKDVDVEWASNLSEDTEIIIAKNVYSFNLDTVNLQGDYEISASLADSVTKDGNGKEKNIIAYYNFSLSSLDKLKNSLSYSFVDAGSSDFDYIDDSTVRFSSIREFNEYGYKINAPSERLTLEKTLTFHATGDNYLYIVQKDGCNLGKIGVSFSDQNDKKEDVSVLYTDEGGFLICLGLNYTNRATVVFTINAGTKDKRELTINLENELVSLPAPGIQIEPSQVSDGKIVHIFGDNISNNYHAIDGGAQLKFEVTRRDYEGASLVESVFATDTEDKGPESKDVHLGHDVHLLYSGYYHVKAYLANGSGRISPLAEADITVEPIETQNDALRVVENFPNLSFDFPEFLSEMPKAGNRVENAVYTVKLANMLPSGTLVYNFKVSSKSGTSDVFLAGRTLNPNEEKVFELSNAGEYEIFCYYKDLKCGKGLDYETDYSSYRKKASFEIKEPFDSSYVTVKKETDSNGQNYYAFIPENIPQDVTVKCAVYENGKRKHLFYFSKDSEAKTFSFTGSYEYSAFECTYSSDNTPLGIINQIELPPFNYKVATGFSDVTEVIGKGTEETYYKQIVAINSYVNSNTFYDMYYCINNSDNRDDIVSSDWTKISREAQAEIKIPASKGEGTYYVHVQLRSPTTGQVYQTRTSQPVIIEKKKLDAVPIIDISDKVQEEYGALEKRVAVIYNVKDFSGRYCRISYSINGSVWIEDLTEEIIVVELLNASDGEGEKTISVKCIPRLDTWQKGETETKSVGYLSKLPYPYAYITGMHGKNWSVFWYTSYYSYKYKIMPTFEGAVVQFCVSDGSVHQTDKTIVEEFSCSKGTYDIKASQHKKGYISSDWPVRAVFGDYKRGSDICSTSGSYCSFPF